jgi:ectoine hydroxylase-related dioxygenase (phytanoyl-CoA dioxygenase family)
MTTNKVQYAERTLADFKAAFEHNGWIIYENAIDSDFVDQINQDLTAAYDLRRSIQEQNGISANMHGTLHHLLERDNFSLKFIEQMYCDTEIRYFLGGNYILNGISAVIHAKNEYPYLSHMHRDIRTYATNSRMLIQMIVTLDDFNRLNGATHFLSGSHKYRARPDEAIFSEKSDRALTSRGSIILFDANVWHASGENFLNAPRRALTLGFTRPYIKQQLDYPRFLGYDFMDCLSDNQRQVIGYNARVPKDLYEYYQPVHLRMYQRDQG